MQLAVILAGVLPVVAALSVLDAVSSDLVARLLSSASPQRLLQELLRDSRRRALAVVGARAGSSDASHQLALGQANVSVSSIADINKELTEMRWALDQKLLECGTQPELLRGMADRASSDVQEIAGEVSQVRGVVLQSSSEYTEDRVVLATLAANMNRGKFECDKVAALQEAKAEDLKEERVRVAELRRLLEVQCPGSTSSALLLQRSRRERRQRQWPDQEVCPRAADALAELEGEIKDKATRLAAEQRDSREACRGDRAFEMRQIGLTSSHKTSLAGSVEEAMSKLGSVTERTRLKDEMRVTLNQKVHSVEQTCNNEVQSILRKLCELQQVRDHMELRDGAKTLPQDCEVSEWREDLCSASCGGGTRVSTRKVMAPAVGGAACPPLSLTGACATQECPIDCEMSEWSGWASCSAPCDGGFQERLRHVTMQPESTGVPCGNLVATRSCNSKACNRDCILGDWSSWSLCSLPCGGGSQERFRQVETRAWGVGLCPVPEDGQRLQRTPCNAHRCPKASNTTCRGPPVDLVLLIDTSGSIGAQGLASFKQLALDLVKRYPLGESASRVAVVSFAGDAQTVSDFEFDPKVLSDKVNAMSWRKGASMLSRGLAAAKALLEGGRRQAAPLVLVVTDGRIADPFVATQVAARVRARGTRLLFALVGRGKEAATLFTRLASTPNEENIIVVPSRGDLAKGISSVAGEILQHTCSTVGDAR